MPKVIETLRLQPKKRGGGKSAPWHIHHTKTRQRVLLLFLRMSARVLTSSAKKYYNIIKNISGVSALVYEQYKITTMTFENWRQGVEDLCCSRESLP